MFLLLAARQHMLTQDNVLVLLLCCCGQPLHPQHPWNSLVCRILKDLYLSSHIRAPGMRWRFIFQERKTDFCGTLQVHC